MCLLGSRLWIITFRGPKSTKTTFRGPEKAFQAKYAKISNSYIFRSVYQIDMKFDRHLRPATETSWMVSYMVIKQFKDGGWPPFWKSIYRHISIVNNHPILMKFCTQQQILIWMNFTWSKIKKVALDRLRVWQNVFLV